MSRVERRAERAGLIAAVRANLPWARVARLWGLVGLPCFTLAVGWALVRHPRLLLGGTLGQAAKDLAVAALVPLLVGVAVLLLAEFGWPVNVLAAVGLVIGEAALLAWAERARGGVWVLDGWRAGVMVTRREPLEGAARVEVSQLWALPPGRGRGLRLREQGPAVADRYSTVLELVAMDTHLAQGIYRRAGFAPVQGQEGQWRPTMRRTPLTPAE
jgi:integrase